MLKVNNFNKVAKESLDQWISFLKTGDIPDSFTAQGLPEARERLRIDSLPDKERQQYIREMERRMIENDVMKTYFIDGHDEGKREVALRMKAKGYPAEDIADITELPIEYINSL